MTIIVVKVNLHDGVTINGRNNISGFNNLGDPASAGVIAADLLDETAAPTGYTLTLNGAFTFSVGNSSYATSSPDARFPVEFFQSSWYVAVADDDAATFTLGNLPAGATYTIEAAAANGNASRPTTFSATNSTPASVQYSPGAVDPVPQPVVLTGTVPVGGEVVLSNIGSSAYAYNNGWILTIDTGPATPNVRKSSTFDIETILSGTVTAATLNGNAITVDSQTGTTVTLTDSGSGITTSGEYNLVLTDDSADPDETITVQVNVVGLASFNINKDGADQGSLTDVEFIILTGAAGSRAINQQATGITTTAGGDTGPIEISDTALNVDDTVTVVQQSPTVGGGLVHTATLGLI